MYLDGHSYTEYILEVSVLLKIKKIILLGDTTCCPQVADDLQISFRFWNFEFRTLEHAV